MIVNLILGRIAKTLHLGQQIDCTSWYFATSPQIDRPQPFAVGKYRVDTLRGQLGQPHELHGVQTKQVLGQCVDGRIADAETIAQIHHFQRGAVHGHGNNTIV